MDKFDDSQYLVDMYADSYFPDFLVDKVKAALAQVVDYLEEGGHSTSSIQARFDEAMNTINDLQDEFEENGSEIETGARESIGQTVQDIIEYFGLPMDVETAMGARDW